MARINLMDANTMFDSALTMASGFDTADSPVTSTNVIDTGSAKSDEYRPPIVQVIVEGGDSVGDAGTIQSILQDSADGSTGWAAIATPPASAVNAGNMDGSSAASKFTVPIGHRRYLRLTHVIAAANFTAGTLHASLTR